MYSHCPKKKKKKKKKFRQNGTFGLLLDEMGLDKMGLDEMARWHQQDQHFNVIKTFWCLSWSCESWSCDKLILWQVELNLHLIFIQIYNYWFGQWLLSKVCVSRNQSGMKRKHCVVIGLHGMEYLMEWVMFINITGSVGFSLEWGMSKQNSTKWSMC